MKQGTTRKLENAISNPRNYFLWMVFVLAALFGTYFMNPYIFAATTFALASFSSVICLVGLSAALLSKAASPRAKAWIVVFAVAAAAASVAALAALGRFNWA